MNCFYEPIGNNLNHVTDGHRKLTIHHLNNNDKIIENYIDITDTSHQTSTAIKVSSMNGVTTTFFLSMAAVIAIL